MLAVDTSVVVRFLTHDDPRQTAQAAQLFRTSEIRLAKTVLLETHSVLRSVYRFADSQVTDSLRAVAGLPNVRLEDSDAVARALDWCDLGIEFADALHVASRGTAAEFVTFDKKLVKSAARPDAGGVVLL